MNRSLFAFAATALFLYAAPCSAEDLYCEVMSVEGSATLSSASVSGKPVREGDLLSVDDVVHVGAGSYVDLAYDRDWNNVTRIEENSSVQIRSLEPPAVELESGGVFAKLKSLPKDSTFEVRTPTAIASVRGTEYRTTYTEGETQVYNVSSSDVYVYGVDESGQKQGAEPVVVRSSQKTFVPHRGEAPRAPQRMGTSDLQRAGQSQKGIEGKIRQNIERGRVGKLPDVGEISRRIQERRQERGGGQKEGNKPHEGPQGQLQGQGSPRHEQGGGRPQAPQGPQGQPAGPGQGQRKPAQDKPAGRPRVQQQ